MVRVYRHPSEASLSELEFSTISSDGVLANVRKLSDQSWAFPNPSSNQFGLSDDGRLLLTGGIGPIPYLWDAQEAQLVWPGKHGYGNFFGCPVINGRFAAFIGKGTDGNDSGQKGEARQSWTVFLFDVLTGDMVGYIKQDQRIGHFAFSPDGERIALSTADKGISIYRMGDVLRGVNFV
jgi:hypothetical protein